MGKSSHLLAALLVSSLLVSGQSCGVMTRADPGEDLASLMAETVARFKTNCGGKCPKKQIEGK